MRKITARLAGAMLAGLAATAQAQEGKMQTLEVIVFAGGSAMPLYVAQDKGFFAREGLTVNVTATPSSGFQMSNLIAGKFQIAGTAVDNLIAYQEGQGTAKVEGPVDLVTIMGGSSTELALMALPSIKTIGELKGKEFALDSLSTGYAFVLRKMLEKNGLQPSDYTFMAVGGTRERLEALKGGKMSAALITEPFTTQAKRDGFTYLGEAVESVGRYQASVQIANRAWAKENEKVVVGYIRGVLAGIEWIYDPKNKEEATKILAGRIKIPEAAAAPTIDGLTKGRAALDPKGKLDVEGLRTVIALREQFAEPKKKLGAPEKYFDETWYQKALAR
ncbi:MAG TPA: ABC transporter substrate-binding protein [Beijerinckiaceae bacterium]|jgi:ABC-type nitrate/sulfonate/bicarbonate transport system substrate-binding protein